MLTRVEPAYPDLARRAGIDGTVELEVAIDATGKVTDVEVVRGPAAGPVRGGGGCGAPVEFTGRPARPRARSPPARPCESGSSCGPSELARATRI